jgi:phosphoribosylformylglycinamidine (FGAM) synthase-like enzyme
MFKKNIIKSCNDISRGGPIHSLITMMTSKLGFHIQHSDELSLFSEYLAGYIMIIDKNNSESIVQEAQSKGIDLIHLGSVKTGAIEINEFQPKFNSIYEVYKNNFSDKIKN